MISETLMTFCPAFTVLPLPPGGEYAPDKENPGNAAGVLANTYVSGFTCHRRSHFVQALTATTCFVRIRKWRPIQP